jgi:hypothetical protein
MRIRAAREVPTESSFALTSVDAEVAVARQVLDRSPEGSQLVFGAPSRCPSCGDFGYVDAVIEQVGAVFNQCFRCERRWTITRRAIEAVETGHTEAPQPPARGVLLERLERAKTDRANAPAPSVRFVSA